MEINARKNAIGADLAAQQAEKIQRARQAKEPQQEKPVEQAQKPEFYQEPDQYAPKEPEAPSGRYWVEPGEDGPRVRFDAPDAPANEGKPAKTTTTNTDEVDREIERARKKVEDLEQQVQRAKTPEDRKRLEKQLNQAERQLTQKDNDAYRRAHAKVTE